MGSSSPFLKKERCGLLYLALIFFLSLKTRSRNISLIRKRFKENNSTSTLTNGKKTLDLSIGETIGNDKEN